MILLELTSASPVPASTPGLGLACSRDRHGQLWLHASLAFDPSTSAEARAYLAAGWVLHLCWEPSPAPRLLPLLPQVELASEAVEERLGDRIGVSVCFADAFGSPLPAPHLPCFVQLACGSLGPVIVRVDPGAFDRLPLLEDQLGTTAADAALRARIDWPTQDDAARLQALDPVLGDPLLRARLIGSPLLEAVSLACTLATSAADPAPLLARAAAWAHELLDHEQQRRHALAVRLRPASGTQAALLTARLRRLELLWRDLTGQAPELAPLFQASAGASLLARRPPD